MVRLLQPKPPEQNVDASNNKGKTRIWFFHILITVLVIATAIRMYHDQTSHSRHLNLKVFSYSKLEKGLRGVLFHKQGNETIGYPDTIQNNNNFNSKTSTRGDTTKVVVYVCDYKYTNAVANSVYMLRKDGGYEGDVLVIIDSNGENLTESIMREQVQQEFNNNTLALDNLFIWTAKNLFDSLLSSVSPRYAYLRDPPPLQSCLSDGRKNGHRAYYLKTLIWHPNLATKWDIVLYMDGCMTIHSPHIHEIMTMQEVKGHVMATPDPWRWARTPLKGRIVPCAPTNATTTLEDLVVVPLEQAAYFNSAFILTDSDIIRGYHGSVGSSAASLIELLETYHQIGPAFDSDQDILSVYWIYVRNLYNVLPSTLRGSPRIPYEFIRRWPEMDYIVTAGHISRPVCLKRPANFHSAIPKQSSFNDEDQKV